MIRTVKLHGKLAEQLGSEPLQLDADTTPLLISGLSSAYSGFNKAFRENSQYQIVRVSHKRKAYDYVTEETALMTFGDADEIHVVPVVDGAGFEIAAMMFVKGTLAYYATAIAVNLAVSFVVNAIARALSPMPKGGNSTPVQEKPSFIFNQVQNVTTPGNPVPLVYGTCLTGSVVISVGVTTEQLITTQSAGSTGSGQYGVSR